MLEAPLNSIINKLIIWLLWQYYNTLLIAMDDDIYYVKNANTTRSRYIWKTTKRMKLKFDLNNTSRYSKCAIILYNTLNKQFWFCLRLCESDDSSFSQQPKLLYWFIRHFEKTHLLLRIGAPRNYLSNITFPSIETVLSSFWLPRKYFILFNMLNFIILSIRVGILFNWIW